MKIRDFFRNLKAGLKFVLHTGQLVNNGLCNEPGKYPLDAAYGRTLLEMIGNTADLPGGAADIVSAIVTQNSNLNKRVYYSNSVIALQSPVVNNVTYRFQVDSRSGGVILYKSEDNGLNWERDKEILSNADFLTKIVSLNQVTVPANTGITGSTNISGQIPSGYKLLDAREVGSGNNGCYIYYFKVDGTNITLQLRNVTNNAITTSPSAQLLLIPK